MLNLRVSGESGEISRLLGLLGQIADVATDDQEYPNGRDFGVRVYAQVRMPETLATQAERVDRTGDGSARGAAALTLPAGGQR